MFFCEKNVKYVSSKTGQGNRHPEDRVARYTVFYGSSRISAHISRLPERSHPGDEISR